MARKNKSNKSKKTKKPKSRPMRRRKGAPMSGSRAFEGHGEHYENVCSMLDPFCPAASGAKLLDDNSARSAVFQSRNIFNVTSDASGDAAFYLSPNPNAVIVPATTIVGDLVTVWGAGTQSVFRAQLGSSIGSWRVVSWGFIFQTTQSNLNATGTMVVTEWIGSNATTSGNTSVNSLSLGPKAKLFAIRDAKVAFVGRSSGMSSNMYTIDSTTIDYNDWTQAIVTFNGAAASTTIGSFEIYVNYEWQASSMATGYYLLTSPAAPSVPAAMHARANAAGVLDTILAIKDTAEVSQKVFEAVDKTAGAVAMAYPSARAAYGAAKMGYQLASYISNR